MVMVTHLRELRVAACVYKLHRSRRLQEAAVSGIVKDPSEEVGEVYMLGQPRKDRASGHRTHSARVCPILLLLYSTDTTSALSQA